MKNIKFNFKLILLLIFSIFFLSSCGLINYIGGMICNYMPDSDHCTQFIAVQTSDSSKCEKIKGSSLKQYGSNPPRDKCYLQIAENTGNESICKNIKGGYMSYTKKECISGANKGLVKNLDKQINELDQKLIVL